jgi:hypothetical protein
MKTVLILTLALFGFLNSCFAQQDTTWDKWEWLLGEWIGTGSGQPGQGGGTFSFVFDLNKKIILRKRISCFRK